MTKNNSKHDEKSILLCTLVEELNKVIYDLTNNEQDEIHKQYRQAVRQQLDHDRELIALLQAEVALLRAEAGNTNPPPISLPIKKNPQVMTTHDHFRRELLEIRHTLDLLELLTGLSVSNFQQEDGNFYFDIEQCANGLVLSTSERLKMEYRLIINENDSDEVEYEPTFINENSNGCEQLKKILPLYLLDRLTFPIGTLGQFYGKVSRALNKKQDQKRS